ncbi:hypothetical protein [Micromonospora sp. WMMD710]|uniref:hypothetical protein n=1 Tax=Micromonospora sp. WMMD710 TaxID=3016085 RepID=UPI0024170C49|nr:hypothetical protein [Micromonospora sp. WMMD710]MDG4762372.1 hypothetical protein [Micromonospora sp. WMMD710]MDG4762384.1 hypothetical protein [Micromonospora sp. WMMD710]MDG4762418.1 hypothetical protein [Micromonospora sp. WMMD710]MDG4762464.1 hypothetical protein [Micromonospora sp. WMMD710]MDG4762499.1 hypothetical protein [Micromonospora sp. WMMD710]
MTRTPIMIGAAVVVLGAGIAGTVLYLDQTGPADQPVTTSTAAADPYDAYLKIAPAGAPKLSREDAQARAVLGCGQAWAPGTVDAALAEAYAALCQRSR